MNSFSEQIIEKLQSLQNFYNALYNYVLPKFRPSTEIENAIISLTNLQVADEQNQQLQQKGLAFLKMVKEMADKLNSTNNTLDPLKKENAELKQYNLKLEAEVLDLQSVQDKIKKQVLNDENQCLGQVDVLHSEIRNLEIELTIKEKESVSTAEKEHMKMNLLKFLQSAIARQSIEGEIYLSVLFRLIGITEQEGEELKKYSPDKVDRKKGLLSFIIRK